MKKELKTIPLSITLKSGLKRELPLSYQIFGKELGTAPVVLINHALTGNSQITGTNGWWNAIIGDNAIISTKKYSILCFNIPGNAYDDFFITDYENFTAADIAQIFLQGLKHLEIPKLHSLIGGSLGGCIAWEMLIENPDLTENFIPIAADHQTHDWLFAQSQIQKYLLESTENPLEKAREHAMLNYRTPQSLNHRFQNKIDLNGKRTSQNWLNYHGNTLSERFHISAYRLMNHLLMTIGASKNKLANIKATINLIAIDSDLLFPASEILETYHHLKKHKKDVFYEEINSIHGHDAFLIEHQQLSHLLNPLFK